MAGRSLIAAILGAGSVLTLSLGGGYLISDTLNDAGDRISHPLKNIQVAKEYIPPEIFTGRAPKPITTSDQYMIVSAHPAASYAGAEILKNGGNAIDAAFAAQMVLNLVEPQSSGIGGGGFMLYYDVKTRDVTAFDGRETA
ncbi:MAG: gamma-glutamyltransferase, partial [Alphaproteobacteria bacterium]|nr:gamma-glutamyltransferase [Alphaproteobacteria bacterium]